MRVRPTTDVRTFGWYRAEILATAINAVILLGVAAFILWDAWQRWNEPPEVTGGLMLAVAIVGGVANLAALLILRGPQARSLNMRGAYLEVLGDLLGSVAVIIAALDVALTGFTQADAVASAAIGIMILPSTWGLLRDAMEARSGGRRRVRVGRTRGRGACRCSSMVPFPAAGEDVVGVAALDRHAPALWRGDGPVLGFPYRVRTGWRGLR